MKSVRVFLFILSLMLFINLSMGCLEDNIEEKKYREIEVGFKIDTNITYMDYLTGKYDIFILAYSENPDGTLDTCSFFIPTDSANEFIDNLKKEEKVEYVNYADVHG